MDRKHAMLMVAVALLVVKANAQEPLLVTDEASVLVGANQPTAARALSKEFQVELRKLQSDVRTLRQDLNRMIESLDMLLSKMDSQTDPIPRPNEPLSELKQMDEVSGDEVSAESQHLKVQVIKATKAQGDQNVRFEIKVTNTSDGELTNLRIKVIPDPNLKPEQGTLGLEITPNANDIFWRVPSLRSQQSVTREIVCVCLTSTHSALGRVVVSADGDVRQTVNAKLNVLPAAEQR